MEVKGDQDGREGLKLVSYLEYLVQRGRKKGVIGCMKESYVQRK